MHSAISAAIAYIEASEAAGTPTELLASIKSDRVNNLKSMLGKTKPSLEDTTAAISLIGSTTAFIQEQKQSLLGAIHTKVQTSSIDNNEGADASKAQAHRYVENYITDALYTILGNTAIPEEERIDAFVDFLQLRNGCKFPDVASRKRFIAIIFLCAGTRATASALKACYDKFAVTNIRKRKFRQHVPTTMRTFPENPKDFVSLHPCLYLEGQPYTTSRLSSSEIDEVVAMTSARKTNNLIACRTLDRSDASVVLPVGPHAHGAGSSMDMPSSMMQMMGHMMQMMHGSNVRRDPGESPVNFTFGPYGAPRPRTQIQDGPSFGGAGGPGASHGGPPPLPDSSETDEVTERVDECEHQKDGEDDDIDAMISNKLAKVAKDGPKKVGKLPVKKQAKKGGKSQAKKCVEDNAFPLNKPPKVGTPLPLSFNGCRVYGSDAKYRVVPFPGKSPYDKEFGFKAADKSKAWARVIAYCKQPEIPTTSANALPK